MYTQFDSHHPSWCVTSTTTSDYIKLSTVNDLHMIIHYDNCKSIKINSYYLWAWQSWLVLHDITMACMVLCCCNELHSFCLTRWHIMIKWNNEENSYCSWSKQQNKDIVLTYVHYTLHIHVHYNCQGESNTCVWATDYEIGAG